MADPVARLTDYLQHADLEGLDQLEDAEVIVNAVVLLRVQRLDAPGSALIMVSDADWIVTTGMLRCAIDVQALDEDD